MAIYPITTYDQLCAAAADWLNRQDLVNQIAAFVTMSTAQFNRELRLRDMMVRADATSDQENVALPGDWLEMYSLVIAPGTPPLSPGWPAWNRPALRYMSEKESNDAKQARYGQPGPPFGYTIIGNMIELVPVPQQDVNLKMVYFQKIPDLGSTSTSETNWLLTKSPDLYLYSTCLQAAPYLKDDDRIQMWMGVRNAIVEGMRMESERALRPTSGLRAQATPF